MPQKNLKKLMVDVETTDSLGNLNLAIKRIAFDSRKVDPGALFVAIPGDKHNGEAFVRDAWVKGAVAF
ncbi:MAG: Mur ligase domain-containing protein, partial [Nitrospinaceae bacterium]|nr:Mur ligase domain-containing protein [Nitrospinaceae bacterium]